MENNYELDMAELERDSEEHLRMFAKAVEKELAVVSTFTEDDIDQLYRMIFENCKDISDLEIYTDAVREKIAKLVDFRERLKFQSRLTKKDIFDENLLNIFLMYNIATLGVWLTSSDPLNFIKKFIIVGIIGYMGYDLNARYFASDTRKEQARKTIEQIDQYVEISKHDIRTFNKFKEMYVDELNLEFVKLFEIYPDLENVTVPVAGLTSIKYTPLLPVLALLEPNTTETPLMTVPSAASVTVPVSFPRRFSTHPPFVFPYTGIPQFCSLSSTTFGLSGCCGGFTCSFILPSKNSTTDTSLYMLS